MLIENRKYAWLIASIILFSLILQLSPPVGMSQAALAVAAIACLMAIFWISEVIPLAVTALIPIVLFPLFDIMSVSSVTSAYANPVIFLFLGGFIIAKSIEKWNLHKRIALKTIRLTGTSPARIILGFMIATALLSMWISNTATCLMMLPVAIAVIHRLNQDISQSVFPSVLMLAIAYSASIGGVATLIGTPPNAILAGVMQQQLDIELNFFKWMLFGVPLATLFLAITWFYLIRRISSEKISIVDSNIFEKESRKLGKMSPEEKRVSVIFLLVSTSWIARGIFDIPFFDRLTDASIAITGAILLFIIPADGKNVRLMDWQTAKTIPWDILILFGGGFALAAGFSSSGLTEWVGSTLGFLDGVSLIVVVFVVALIVIFLTEVTSNTATASLLIPLMGALATALNVSPELLMLTVAVAASYAFMLPVATPPNAIVYSSRLVEIKTMAKTGFYLNLIGSILITLFALYFLPLVWSI